MKATKPHIRRFRGWWACSSDGRTGYGVTRREAYIAWSVRWNGISYDVVDRYSRQWVPLVPAREAA